MKLTHQFPVLFLVLLLLYLPNTSIGNPNLIKTKAKAIRLAKIVWIPIYGRRLINKEAPFKATLVNDSIWQVVGTLHSKKGGTAYIELQKSDGKVLKVTHYK